MLNIPEIIIYWQRIGLMLIKAYSTFRIKHYGDIHLRGLEIDRHERYTHYVYEKQKANPPLGDCCLFTE